MSKQQNRALDGMRKKLEAVRKNVVAMREEARYANLMDLVRRYGDIIHIIDMPENNDQERDWNCMKFIGHMVLWWFMIIVLSAICIWPYFVWDDSHQATGVELIWIMFLFFSAVGASLYESK